MTRPALLLLALACTEPKSGGEGGSTVDDTDGGVIPAEDDGGGEDGGGAEGDDTAPVDSGDTGEDPVDPPAEDACSPAPPLREFITREGDQLYEGDEPFRFVSVNVAELLGIVDPGWFIPTPWEQRDALCAVRQMGGRVARTYVLSVGGAVGGVPRHVEGPGLLNEEQMVGLDHALAAANEQGVRLIIPLVDQWWWVGGIAEHAAFRGKSSSEFWTDPTLIADFIGLIDQVVNRVNTVTGVRYAEDPAILAWETGNELYAPPAWTAQIAAALKDADPNHLVVDGTYGIIEENLDNEDIDIVSDHYYWPSGYGDDYAAAAADDRALTAGRRPFVVGEFGLVATERIQALLDEVVDNGTAGAMIWSLRFHDESGGFYWHTESAPYAAYHWPGFDSGDSRDERVILAALAEAAARVGPVPELLPPPAPVVLAVEFDGSLRWQGSAGAATYTLERATDAAGPWTVILDGFDDAVSPNEAVVTDPAPLSEGMAWYRLTAVGAGGASAPSAPWGPVMAGAAFTDPLSDLSMVSEASATMAIDSSNSGNFDGDSGRATRTTTADGSLTWAPGGTILAVEVEAWAWPYEDLPAFSIAVSADGAAWTEVAVTTTDLGGDWTSLRLSATSLPADAQQVRVTLSNPSGKTWNPQIGALRLLTAP
jgi:hypothetical protein